MKLDQHFLIDKEAISTIISEAEIEEKDTVIEIGAGTGNITSFIPPCNLIIIEKDEELAEMLEDKFKNAQIIRGNALEFVTKIRFDVLISALPYSISEPILRKLLLLDFKRVVLVLPKKIVENITNKKTVLGLLINAFLNFRVIREIKRRSFYPVPRTDSYIVKITKKDEINEEEKVVRGLYMQHDKKLKNALREYLIINKKTTKRKAKEIINKIGLSEKSLNHNVKNISLNDWIKTINFITEELQK